MLVLLLFNSPVPVPVRREIIVIGSPAVSAQPGSVFRRLMSLYKVLLGIVVIPPHDANRMRIIKCTLIGILCPVRAEVFPLFRRLVRPRAFCVYRDRDTAVCQQLLFNRFCSSRIIGIDLFFPILGLHLRRTGQNIGVLESVRLIETVFFRNIPIVVLAVAHPPHAAVLFTVFIVPGDDPALCLAVSSPIYQHLFITFVQTFSVLQVRPNARGVQPGRKTHPSSYHLLRAGCFDRKMLSLAILRVLRVIQ